MKYRYKVVPILLGLSISVGGVFTQNLIASEKQVSEKVKEDKGIVLEKNIHDGYIKIKNIQGNIVKHSIDLINLRVEKLSFYEEDKIGGVDKLFPNTLFNPKTTAFETIQIGDSIYLQLDEEGVFYISVVNEYYSRYGKVIGVSSQMLTIEGENKIKYHYKLSATTGISKSGSFYTLQDLKVGEWVKVLLCERPTGIGEVETDVLQISVDPGSRKLEGLYLGTFLAYDYFQDAIYFSDVKRFNNHSWNSEKDIKSFNMKAANRSVYLGGQKVSLPQVANYLKSTLNTTYLAVEKSKGKETVLKMSVQAGVPHVLPSVKVVYATPQTLILSSGEFLVLREDTIIIKNGLMVDAFHIKEGDNIRVTTSVRGQAAIVEIIDRQQKDSLKVYRGFISKIEEGEWFELKQLSLLENGDWFRMLNRETFSLSTRTRFYTSEGLKDKGLESFVDYGENGVRNREYTIIEKEGEALAVVEMPSTSQLFTGIVYATEKDKIKIKDVKYKNSDGKWKVYDRANEGLSVDVAPNTVILKQGELVPVTEVKKGDKVEVMAENMGSHTENQIEGFIIKIVN